jgi:hypothetical protein
MERPAVVIQEKDDVFANIQPTRDPARVHSDWRRDPHHVLKHQKSARSRRGALSARRFLFPPRLRGHDNYTGDESEVTDAVEPDAEVWLDNKDYVPSKNVTARPKNRSLM